MQATSRSLPSLKLVPALLARSLDGVLAGAIVFGLLRLAATIAVLRWEFGEALRPATGL